MATLQNVIAELEKLFDALNSKYFDNKLVKPVIIVQANGKRKNVLGHCSTYEAWADKESLEKHYEISISAEYLDRPFTEVAGTLLHEMVHLSNLKDNIKDCGENGYHNKKFEKKANQCGLLVLDRSKSKGFAFTEPTEDTKEFLKTVSVNKNVFTLARINLSQPNNKPKKNACRKYACPVPNCKTTARTTKDTSLICGICKTEMILEN